MGFLIIALLAFLLFRFSRKRATPGSIGTILRGVSPVVWGYIALTAVMAYIVMLFSRIPMAGFLTLPVQGIMIIAGSTILGSFVKKLKRI